MEPVAVEAKKCIIFISASLHCIPTGSEVFGYIATLGSNFWIAFIKLTLVGCPDCPDRTGGTESGF